MTKTTIVRAAIYARYSTDMQKPTSVADQNRICEALCKDRGYTVVQFFSDDAISGQTDHRPGYQDLLRTVERGSVDVIVAESIDRMSRDAEHTARLYKMTQFRGVEIVTILDGDVDDIRLGVNSLMSTLFLKNLAQKTRRGLEGRVLAGKSAGGLSYGYAVVRTPLPDGTFTTGELAINEDEAAVVQRIFRDYAKGLSSRSIAMALNAEGVSAPRGDNWSFSTISGNWKRGTGILNNELYAGVRVWNRQRFVKDPATSKRQAIPNLAEAWVIEEIEDLRIVDVTLWDAVKTRQTAVREDIIAARTGNTAAPGNERGRRARYLFSGVVECAECSGNYIMISQTHYGCAAARNKGTCDNRRAIGKAELEERVLSGLRHHLMAPDMVAAFIKTYHEEMQVERRAAIAGRAGAERQLKQVQGEIDNLIDAIAKGMFHPSMKVRMDGLEDRKTVLEAELNAMPDASPVALHPGIADAYAKKVADLITCLNDPAEQTEAGEIIRSLIDRIVITPANKRNLITLEGALAGILSLCASGMDGHANARWKGGRSGQVTVVAGVGFEPTTFRL
jgi:site-specific DNA recombinase